MKLPLIPLLESNRSRHKFFDFAHLQNKDVCEGEMKKSILRIHDLIFLLLISCSLQACVDVAMTGAQVVYNRQSIQKNLNDHYITMQAYKTLNIDSEEFKNANIDITTYNNEILLAGQVPTPTLRMEAEERLKSISDVKHIYNLITIGAPTSTLTKISDAWITAKVKSKFLASNELDASQIKVVTENGVVYLMGILKPEEAQEAVEIASNTDGVASVVKIFTYIQIIKKPV